ncbi:ZIP family metal transporter [Candidatus Macondimonas diazotrophica]|uniref:ZIP family metal transporter n=1 Tax=Candidatus Macondimonas diazotrophica TaxID=2305248 RepID=UPI003BEEFF17
MRVADGVHNLLGGRAIGAIFVVDLRAGIAAWTAAALHEIPQEIGDFGAMLHAGYSRRQALSFAGRIIHGSVSLLRSLSVERSVVTR